MAAQLDLFAPDAGLPEGFRYQPELLSAPEERELLARFPELSFDEFEFQGYVGKRRVVSFGWRYDFTLNAIQPSDEMPGFLLPVRDRCAAFAGIPPGDLQQVLVTEYRPGAGIGWHKDKPVFATVVGLSLAAPCLFRLRRSRGTSWERRSLTLEPRSAYLLEGPSRTAWEHSIPAVESLRYSVTFRSFRSSGAAPG